MSLFQNLRVLRKLPKIGCLRRQTGLITMTQQHISWSTVRENGSFTNKMHSLRSQFKNLFRVETSEETKTSKARLDANIQQQVTPIVTEMIVRQSTLDSMLYICEKLLPKMTLADKSIVQEVLTDKLFEDIVSASPDYINEQSKIETHLRLLVDSKLSEAAKPLSSSKVFRKLVEDVAADSEYLTNRQALSLFLNLQLLNWEKECKEVFQLFDRVCSINVHNLNIEEIVIYVDASKSYNSFFFTRHVKYQLLNWCDMNEIDLENFLWYKIIEKLSELKVFSADSKDQIQDFCKKFEKKLTEQNIQNIGIAHCSFLLEILSQLDRTEKWVFNKSTNSIHKKVKNHLCQLIDDISDIGDQDIFFLSKAYHLDDECNSLSTLIDKKYFQPALDGKVLKSNAFMYAYMLSLRMNNSGVMKDDAKKTKISEIARHCIKTADAISLKRIGNATHRNFRIEHGHSLKEKIESFVKDGLFDRDDVPVSLKKYYGNSLYTISKIIKTDVHLRDRFLEFYLNHYIYDRPLQAIGCDLCLMCPEMTSTSIKFLENVKDLKSYPYIALSMFVKTKRKAKDAQYRRKICQVSFSQSNSALCNMESDLIAGVCHNYEPSKHSSSQRFQDVYLSEPSLVVLSRHALNHLMANHKKISGTLYHYSKTDPRTFLDYIYDTSQKELIPFFDRLLICMDSFFGGYRPGDEKKISHMLQQYGTADHLKDHIIDKLLNQKKIAWNLLLKDYKLRKHVDLPKSTCEFLKKAFDNNMGFRIQTRDNLYLGAVVLLDSSYKSVPFSEQKLKNAEKLGLTKVAFIFFGYKNLASSVMRVRLIKDLQNAGFKCVVIWKEEIQSIYCRTLEERINLIKTKVQAENAIINTAPKLLYDPINLKDGPYKKYFSQLSKEKLVDQKLME